MQFLVTSFLLEEGFSNGRGKGVVLENHIVWVPNQ